MASTILTPIAQKLVDIGDGLALSNGVTTTGYLWERPEFDKLPAVVVEPPDGRRRNLDEAESQLGSEDWFPRYQVSLYVDLDEPARAQEQMVEMLEALIAAVDDDPSLGLATVLDCKVTSWEKFTSLNRNKPLCGYECSVDVYRLVPGP